MNTYQLHLPTPTTLTPVDLGEPIVKLVGRPADERALTVDSAMCALLESGRVKCWGRARAYEDEIAYGDYFGEVGPALPYVALD